MAEQEIKTETNWLGEKKEVIYEGGIKVGETKHETNIWGTPTDRTYDTGGNLVSETKHETNIWGTPVSRTYEPGGCNPISETRQVDTLFGQKTVIIEDGQRVGEIERNQTLGDVLVGYNGRKKIKSSRDKNINPLTRTTRSGNPSSSEGVVKQSTSSSYGGSNFTPKTSSSSQTSQKVVNYAIIILFGLAVYGISTTTFPARTYNMFKSTMGEFVDNVVLGYNGIERMITNNSNENSSTIRHKGIEEKLMCEQSGGCQVEPANEKTSLDTTKVLSKDGGLYSPDCIADGDNQYDHQLGEWSENGGYCKGYDKGYWRDDKITLDWTEKNFGKRSPSYFCWNAAPDGTSCRDDKVCKDGVCVKK